MDIEKKTDIEKDEKDEKDEKIDINHEDIKWLTAC